MAMAVMEAISAEVDLPSASGPGLLPFSAACTFLSVLKTCKCCCHKAAMVQCARFTHSRMTILS